MQVVCGLLLCVLLALLGFALYSALYGAQDANNYYLDCVQVMREKQAGPNCVDSTKSDCVFAPRRTCAMSTIGYMIGSVFFWVLYVAILPVIGPFAVWDWIVGLF